MRTQSIPAAKYRELAARQVREKDFQGAVDRTAKLNGHLGFHVHRSEHSPAGFPDCFYIINGLRCGIGEGDPLALDLARRYGLEVVVAELKRVGENPTPDQYHWLYLFQAMGFKTYLWRPTDEDWREIDVVLGPRAVKPMHERSEE